MSWYVLELPHIQMAGWRGIYSLPQIIVVGQKYAASVIERTKQSGAQRTCLVPWPRQPTEVCSNRPLDPTVADCSVYTGQSDATVPESPWL
jgi:hypothetical protein